MENSVSILIKLLFVILGCGVMIISKHIPYKWVQPKPSLYTVTDKETYMRVVRNLLYITGIYYIFVGLLSLMGFESYLLRISIVFVPFVLINITNIRLKKYYRKINP